MSSKLSFQTFGDEPIAAQINAAHSVGLMTIDYPGLLTGVPAGRVKIGRLLAAGEQAVRGMSPDNSTAAAVVQKWLDAVGYIITMQPGVFWTGPINEGGNLENPVWMKWYGDIELIRQQRLKTMGLKAAILNFSAAANIFDKAEPLRECLAYAKQVGNVYGTHGYSSPRLMSRPDNLLNHRALKAALGFIPKVVYTEFGADAVYNAQGQSNSMDGWRECGISEAEYVSDLIWADNELRADPDVLAAFIYIWTSRSGHFGWNCIRGGGANDQGVGNLVLNYVNSVYTTPPTPPDPTPVPPPTSGKVKTVGSVNLRRQPVIDTASVIKVLPSGYVMDVAGPTSGDFVQVKAWLHKDYIKPA